MHWSQSQFFQGRISTFIFYFCFYFIAWGCFCFFFFLVSNFCMVGWMIILLEIVGFVVFNLIKLKIKASKLRLHAFRLFRHLPEGCWETPHIYQRLSSQRRGQLSHTKFLPLSHQSPRRESWSRKTSRSRRRAYSRLKSRKKSASTPSHQTKSWSPTLLPPLLSKKNLSLLHLLLKYKSSQFPHLSFRADLPLLHASLWMT